MDPDEFTRILSSLCVSLDMFYHCKEWTECITMLQDSCETFGYDVARGYVVTWTKKGSLYFTDSKTFIPKGHLVRIPIIESFKQPLIHYESDAL